MPGNNPSNKAAYMFPIIRIGAGPKNGIVAQTENRDKIKSLLEEFSQALGVGAQDA
jgi:hypothetical protein